MILCRFLLLTSVAGAISTSSPAIELGEFDCAPPQPSLRNNPRPLDCIGAITYILSVVPNRSQFLEFATNPTQGQVKIPFGHSIGTCLAFVVPAQRTSTAPTRSSFDEIVRNMLFSIGKCLLNNAPEDMNWGGGGLVGEGNGLMIGVSGTKKTGIGNDTANLGETILLPS